MSGGVMAAVLYLSMRLYAAVRGVLRDDVVGVLPTPCERDVAETVEAAIGCRMTPGVTGMLSWLSRIMSSTYIIWLTMIQGPH